MQQSSHRCSFPLCMVENYPNLDITLRILEENIRDINKHMQLIKLQ